MIMIYELSCFEILTDYLCEGYGFQLEEAIKISDEILDLIEKQGLEVPDEEFKFDNLEKDKKDPKKIQYTRGVHTVSATPGKIFNKLFPELKDHEIKELVDSYYLFTDSENNTLKFKLTNDFSWLSRTNYINNEGSLGNSCMGYSECQSYFTIYEENNNIQLLIFIDNENKLYGRALVWETNQGIIMDRIFSISHDVELAFKKYAQKNGWIYKAKQNYSSKKNFIDGDYFVLVEVEDFTNYPSFPYLDTFSYGLSKDGQYFLANGYIKGYKQLAEFTKTNGGGLYNKEDVFDETKQQLINAAIKGNLDEVMEVIENGVDIHVENDVALKWAVFNENVDMVKYLVENGANIHADDDYALRWTAQNGCIEIVKFLVENGANVHAGNNYALRWAAGKGYIDVVKYLIENGANVYADDIDGDSILRWAADYEHLDIVEYLKQFYTEEELEDLGI